MFTIDRNENVYVVNKSKFIVNLFYINSMDDVNEYLNSIKKKYKDATHHCYAYIIDNIKRFDDDNEPSGTAGMPILNSLEKNNLNHILCIVTRYFGGIKLGASNLLRAYSNSVSETIKNSNLLELINGYEVVLTFDYNKTKEIDNILSNYEIIEKTFDKVVKYTTYINSNVLDKIKNIANIDIKKEIIIKKGLN